MTRPLLTLAALLFVADVGCLPLDLTDEEDDSHLLPVSARPVEYNISLLLNANQSRFNGSVEILLSVLAATDTLTLHCEGLDITNSTFFRVDSRRGRVKVVMSPVRYEKETHRCAFTLAGAMASRNSYVLALEFNGTYDTGLGISNNSYTAADGTKK